ncbi:hypothetical protein [Mesorhizobium sp.]|uniref:hypothetical protein n=1 Tax=Mesorhizobium sp. TaxID=1871066 RepID=UPI00344D0677
MYLCPSQHRRHGRILFQRTSGFACRQAFFTKTLDRHGRPYRVVIDGSQTNQEAIVSCDTRISCRIAADAD